MTNTRKLRPATQLVQGGTNRSQFGETSEALFLTQGFVYDSSEAAEARFKGEEPGFIYSRYANPTTDMFEKRMCMLECAEVARATASGMAAVAGAILCQLKAGDHVVSARALFGSCRWVVEKLMPKYGIETTFVDGRDLSTWEKAVRPNTKVFFLESPTNPTLEVVDIAAVARLADQAGAKLVVDNVFATPILQKPLELGAHVVAYSATKHIDGQGRALGGVILGTRDFIRGTVEPYMKHTGGSLSPFNAWVMLKGLETLSLRVNAQADSALKIAAALDGHPALARTIYPGLPGHAQNALVQTQLGGKGGTVLSLDLKGGKAAAFKFLNALTIPVISNNLGDAKSIATHPATTTHQRLSDELKDELGITPGLIRFSVGLEDTDDLIADLKAALEAASA